MAHLAPHCCRRHFHALHSMRISIASPFLALPSTLPMRTRCDRAFQESIDQRKTTKDSKKRSKRSTTPARLQLLLNQRSYRLVDHASLYRDLSSFLDDLALGSPQDGYEAQCDVVALMTIHAAKGLEFDYVFVPGLEDGILPLRFLKNITIRTMTIAPAATRLPATSPA